MNETKLRFDLISILAVGILVIITFITALQPKQAEKKQVTLEQTEKEQPRKGPDRVVEYVVKQGDTLVEIASFFDVSLIQIVGSNDIKNPNKIHPGQVLKIPLGGIIHKVKVGQTLYDISKTYEVSLQKIINANDLEGRKYIYPGEEFFIPGANTSPKFNATRLSKGKETEFIWPLLGEITSGFGPRVHPITGKSDFHEGIDIEVEEGTPVHASRMGRVIYKGESSGYGKLIIIEHNGYRTYYAHLSSIFVYKGQFVEAGQIIGLSGNTGTSTGPHLHFEIRVRGRPVNPLRYLP
jgi:murein DD-endopeptidase MepM/ murein hydrolase activator NlpD